MSLSSKNPTLNKESYSRKACELYGRRGIRAVSRFALMPKLSLDQ
jgi:hypothetical protein